MKLLEILATIGLGLGIGLEGTHFIRHYSCKIPDKAGCK